VGRKWRLAPSESGDSEELRLRPLFGDDMMAVRGERMLVSVRVANGWAVFFFCFFAGCRCGRKHHAVEHRGVSHPLRRAYDIPIECGGAGLTASANVEMTMRTML
jgi:hypothetical protein